MIIPLYKTDLAWEYLYFHIGNTDVGPRLLHYARMEYWFNQLLAVEHYPLLKIPCGHTNCFTLTCLYTISQCALHASKQPTQMDLYISILYHLYLT